MELWENSNELLQIDTKLFWQSTKASETYQIEICFKDLFKIPCTIGTIIAINVSTVSCE